MDNKIREEEWQNQDDPDETPNDRAWQRGFEAGRQSIRLECKPTTGKGKLDIAKEALWKITTDYHEDNPDRHINPISAWEVAEEALKNMGEMKNEH